MTEADMDDRDDVEADMPAPLPLSVESIESDIRVGVEGLEAVA